MIWGCCTIPNRDEGYVCCSKCKKAHHYACLSLEPTTVDSSVWACPECNSFAKPNRKDNTPIRSNANISARPTKRHAKSSPQSSPPNVQLTPTVVSQIVRDVVAEEINGLISRLTGTMTDIVHKELNTIKEEMKEVKESMQFMSNQFDDIARDQREAKELIKNLESENTRLRVVAQELANRVYNLEQHARSSNLEIQCIPEKNKENLLSIVSNLGQAVKCPIKEDDILHCTRISKLNRASTRPRSVVVQLATPMCRNRLLSACQKFNRSNSKDKLSTNHIGLSGTPSPIYVCEHLSPATKALHAAARLKAKEKCYNYVWVRNGKIFVKKVEHSETIYIKDQRSLEKIN